MFKHIFLPLTVSAFISGCASTYDITYNAEPQGAAVICDGVNKGYAPTTLRYQVDQSNRENGTLNTVPCHAQWSSGASEVYPSSHSMTQFPNGVMYTLPRPDVPGYQQDAEFALKVESMKIQQRQAQAAEAAAQAAAAAAYEAKRQNDKICNLTYCY